MMDSNEMNLDDDEFRDMVKRWARKKVMAGRLTPSGSDETSWQPIETAPRDGTSIIATGLNEGRGPRRHYAVARYDNGWRRASADWLSHLSYLTHWMPLPDPPEDQP